MTKTTFALVSIKSKNRYKNLLCQVPDELLDNTEQIIKDNLDTYYSDFTNYIFISTICKTKALELLKNSNYKKIDLSNIKIETKL